VTVTGKRAQGLSVNMMILIALGLIVLVIAALMFTRSARTGAEQSSNCEFLGGTCKPYSPDQNGQAPANICDPDGRAFGNCKDTQTQKFVCCARPANAPTGSTS
jgi:hypothetical protein